MTWSQQPVLITGGAGFIGSALVRQWLAEEPSPVVTLDRFTYAGLRISLEETADDPRHTIVEGDVADAPLVRSLLAEHKPRAILHLAAESHVDRSIAVPPEFARTNVLGTCVLLDEATRYWSQLGAAERDAFRFLLVSTDEVFGAASPEAVFGDDSSLEPNSPYAASKAAAEHFARAFAHTYGLPVVTVNPTNNYGPRQMPEKLIPRMILAAARGEALPVYGDGLHQRDWLHVDDCCRAIRLALACGAPGRRYLVGSGVTTTNLDVVHRICDLVDVRRGASGGRVLVAHVADRPGHDRRYAVDGAAIRALGWTPTTDFNDGLRAAVDWYLEHPRWVAAAEESLRAR